MNHQYPFVKPHRHPNCLLLSVQLRGSPSRRGRRTFFARMHARCRELGLVMGQKFGTCLLFGAERICTPLHRHQIVGWLIDQPETGQVGVGEIEHLGDVIVRANPLPRAGGAGRAGRAEHRTDVAVWRAAVGALSQWVQYLQGRLP